jgi:kumamolisin
MPKTPRKYVRLPGSERKPGANARLLGPADKNESFKVTIVLRRRPDGPPVPDFDHYRVTPPAQRRRLPAEEFARKYGADPADIERVEEFVRSHGLAVVETHAARRTVIVSGTVAQFSEAFRVELKMYEHQISRGRRQSPRTETYRGRDGFIHIPDDLVEVIVGVFGLDTRSITKRNAADPPNTNPISTTTITKLYDFPTISATGQTIAILSLGGYISSDISATFGGSPPVVIDVSVDASNGGFPDGETTQDICIAGLAAPGAAIAPYFTTGTQQGWVDLIHRVVHPSLTDPVCSVFSSSFYVADGDDTATLANEGISISWLNAVNAAFQDAAIQGVTICIASGDTGANSKVGANPAAWFLPFAKLTFNIRAATRGCSPWVARRSAISSAPTSTNTCGTIPRLRIPSSGARPAAGSAISSLCRLTKARPVFRRHSTMAMWDAEYRTWPVMRAQTVATSAWCSTAVRSSVTVRVLLRRCGQA